MHQPVMAFLSSKQWCNQAESSNQHVAAAAQYVNLDQQVKMLGWRDKKDWLLWKGADAQAMDRGDSRTLYHIVSEIMEQDER